MEHATLHEEDEEDGETATETSALTTPRVTVPIVVVVAPAEPNTNDNNKVQRNGDGANKPPRRLSFHDSVNGGLGGMAGKGRLTKSTSKLVVNRTSKLLELPFATPPGQTLNHPDAVRGAFVVEKYISQMSSFDLPVLCKIIFIFCVIGWITGSAEILVQMIGTTAP